MRRLADCAPAALCFGAPCQSLALNSTGNFDLVIHSIFYEAMVVSVRTLTPPCPSLERDKACMLYHDSSSSSMNWMYVWTDDSPSQNAGGVTPRSCLSFRSSTLWRVSGTYIPAVWVELRRVGGFRNSGRPEPPQLPQNEVLHQLTCTSHANLGGILKNRCEWDSAYERSTKHPNGVHWQIHLS